MANKTLSSLHGPWDRMHQAMQTDRAAVEDISTYSPLSGEHEDLLDYYFGEPTSTFKHSRHSTAVPHKSVW